jgi:tetratricopeptide (TPR) repeat protein
MKMPGASILILLFLYACQSNSQIIYKDQAGHIINKNDLAHCTGQVNYEIMNNHTIQSAAKQLHNEARILGQSGKYDEAIEKLEAAIKIEPVWAYPVYDLAFTYLLKGDSIKALEYYQKTDQLAPKGFFTTKTALYSLEGEKTGKFPTGLYMAYMQIEWTDAAAEKMQIAKIITERVPAYAPAWKELATLTNDNTLRLEAINTGLSKDPDTETKGILLINKAIVLNNTGKREEAKKILGDIIFSDETTASNVELAKFTLNSITTD